MPPEIYLDNNATTHLSAGVRNALAESLGQKLGNPSSEHRSGERTRRAMARARDSIAGMLNAPTNKILFGSGATELNYWVIANVLRQGRAASLVTSQVEHSCVLETAAFLESEDVQVTRLPVDRGGRIDLPLLIASLKASPTLVSIQWVNNETGVVQPVEEIARACTDAGVPFHCDAAQAMGKLNIDLSETDIDYLTVSAHKMHGPAGVGALYARDAATLAPLLRGGSQENGLRPGTENILGIIGFGQAAAERTEELDSTLRFVAELRDRFETLVHSAMPQIVINGSTEHRVCNSTNMMFPGLDGAAIVALLDRDGVRCSQSSACTSNRPEPSYVLRAMGLSEEEAFASVRFSFSNQNTIAEVDTAASKLVSVVSRLAGGIHQRLTESDSFKMSGRA